MDILTPSPTSVYLYYDRHDILIYVGITSRGMKRQSEHNDTKDWWGFVARQEVEHFSSRSEALSRERALIIKHAPPFNKQHNPDADKVRDAYLLFAAASSQPENLSEAARRLHRQLPLEHHEFGNHANVVLRTRLDDSLLAAVLRMPDRPVPAYGLQRKKSLARVVRIEKAGPIALLHLSQQYAHPIKSATAAIRFDNKQRLFVKGVQVVLDHSDEAACNPRCPTPRVRWDRPEGRGAA